MGRNSPWPQAHQRISWVHMLLFFFVLGLDVFEGGGFSVCEFLMIGDWLWCGAVR